MEKRYIDFFNACTKAYNIDLGGTWTNMDLIIKETHSRGELYNQLKLYGNGVLTEGVNIKDYNYTDDDIIQNHIRGQEETFKNLTKLDTHVLKIPKSFNVKGNDYDMFNNIPITAYRIGYYMYNVSKLLNQISNNQNRKKTVLEIGAGFGLGALISQRININTNLCYIIVDIPSTSIISAYFLINMGYNVLLFGEFDKWSDDLINKYDIIIVSPTIINNLKNIDVVVNTASLSEMPPSIQVEYLNFINNSNCKFFYSDNHHILSGPNYYSSLDNNILSKMSLTKKIITPINYLIPVWYHMTIPFEERIYTRKNL